MTGKEWVDFLNIRVLAAEAGQPTPIDELKPLLNAGMADPFRTCAGV
jgi:hypothetical protein